MNTILVEPSWQEVSFQAARAGDEFVVFLHGLGWPPELRAEPPRLRLLEDCQGPGRFTRCEIMGEWPGAPEYWPQHRDPATERPAWDLSGGRPVPGR